MYLSPTKRYWSIDIEGDLIPSTKIYCLCAVNVMTGEVFRSHNTKEISEWITAKKAEGCKFIGHNIIGYDAPTLNRLLATKLTPSDVIDTLILSMLYSPSLEGGHSLEEWGKRLTFPKQDYNDFSQWTPEMEDYCMNDAELCRRIYMRLIKRMKDIGYSEQGIQIEHFSWGLIKKQQDSGFAFDIKQAHILYATLKQKENDVAEQLHEYFPATLERLATYKKPFKKNGERSASFIRHCKQYKDVRIDGEEYHCYDYVSFNIGSPSQRLTKLLELGWEPREFTEKGTPQPTIKGQLTPSLVEFVEKSGNKEPGLIAKWLEYNTRASMINTWIEAYNETTGCIHGSLWLANTLRYRHSNPNTANIPAVRLDKQDKPLLGEAGVYTYEARDLWGTRDPINRSLVGVDAKGIQLRVLAHYLNNKSFAEAVVEGDPHSYNQSVGGFKTRAQAKTFIYAFLLGAGDAKVGEIIGGSPKDGKEIKQRFISNFPGLRELLRSLEDQIIRTNRILLIDGTSIIVNAPHTRLGYLLQGDENRIMKQASILTHKEIVRRGLDVIKVGDIHDEWQNDVLNKDVSEFAKEVCPKSFKTSGELFKYRVPIECDAKVGKTWAETH
jgi:DNA polymerase I